jgi:NDP-sugar pyrophosphorylase family protein
MRAVILAAGRGERLGGLSQRTPKPMIEFRGKPILLQNVELCKRAGVKDIYMNLHHLPEVIRKYFGDGSEFGVNITYSFEEQLLGTAGAVRRIADCLWSGPAGGDESDALEGDEYFFVVYGDNYSECDLNKLLEAADATKARCVIGFHYREDVAHSGVAEFAPDGRITRFIEKPQPGVTDSHWVNAGIYCMRYDALRHLPEGVSDFARDIFPELLAKGEALYGVCYSDEVRAFDTPEMMQRSITYEKE